MVCRERVVWWCGQWGVWRRAAVMCGRGGDGVVVDVDGLG